MAEYSEYKESGQQWLGKVPSHWGILPGKAIFTENKVLNKNNVENFVLSLSYGRIIPKKDINEGLVPENYSAYQVVESGYIIIRCTDMQNDKVSLRTGLVEHHGIISGAYLGLIPQENNTPSFLKYLLHNWDISKELYRYGSGLRQSLSWKDIKYLLLPIPPREEQEAIVEYLDKVTADIDKAIAAKERIIASLEERRKIIITHAVTRGINSDVPLKDSGIDWLGQIPAHWDILPIKRVAYLILGKMLDNTGGSSSSATYPYFCAKDVHFDNIDCSDLKRMFFSASEIKRYKVNNGDLLVVEGGAGAGGCAIVKNITDTICVQNSIIIVRPSEDCLNEFLSFALQSLIKRGYIDYACNKATIPHFTKEKLGSVLLGFPKKEEQKKIVQFIEQSIIPLDTAITQQKKLIELLRERKNIIINETVTGKVKVI